MNQTQLQKEAKEEAKKKVAEQTGNAQFFGGY